MAVTLAAWTTHATTLSSSPGTCTRFDLPERAVKVRISCTAVTRYSFAGTDGAAIGSNVISIPTSGMPHTLDVGGRAAIFIASATHNAVVELLAMD